MGLEGSLGESGGGVLVSEKYGRFFVGVMNGKMEENMKWTYGFFMALMGRDELFGSTIGELIGEKWR